MASSTEYDAHVSPRAQALFKAYARRYMSRRFHGVRVAGTRCIDAHLHPVVVYTNHPSWWDPLLMMLSIESLFPDRMVYGPIDAQALERYQLLEKVGMFGIESGKLSGAKRFLRVADKVLGSRNTILALTAQGRFEDPRQRPVRLMTGVSHIAARHAASRNRDRGSLLLVPLALEYAFWNESKPEALARFGRPVDTAAYEHLTTSGWATLLESALERTMDELARDARSRDQERFRTLIEGRVGVGGIYDLGRRLKAVLTGRSFDAAHESQARRSN